MAKGFGELFQSASQALGLMSPGGTGTRGGGMMGSILGQLGYNGDQGRQTGGLGEKLGEQVNGETDEQRRKRLRDQQTGAVSPGGAVGDLFGGMGGLQY